MHTQKTHEWDVNVEVMRACLSVLQVDKYLKDILQDVISNLTSNTWRVRESRYTNKLLSTSTDLFMISLKQNECTGTFTLYF